jgi:prepilin-type N-terminal cleavage/methylation domain-containing protein
LKNLKNKTESSKLMRKRGFTLIEIVVAMAAGLIVVLIVGSLLVSGQRSWARAFNYANSKPQIDALASTITFGSIGRKSNRNNYALYEVSGEQFEQVPLPTNPEQVITGQAVEFRYWDGDLSTDIMDTSITATAYALFYLEGDKLMLDLGPYPPGGPGGVNGSGHRIEGPSVTTMTLVENVVNIKFSHTTRDLNGDGKGCVRMNVTVLDPNSSGTATTITAATLMRNVWP